ncbi:MAG: hypothetical protein IJ398_04130 [Clostridia bacterium]|nr:hypothetical protein [Clostridia bacterium]
MAEAATFKEKASQTWGMAKETGKEAWEKTKEGTKKAWSKTKEVTKKGWEKGKKTYGETKTDWKASYSVGFNSGVNDYEYVASRFGSKFMATVGYRNGLREAHRNAKYLNKINKDK